MKNTYLILYILIFSTTNTYAQIAINKDSSPPDPAAILDISSTDKGVLIPRMTTTQRDAIINPNVGLTIFNLDDNCTDIYDGSAWMKDCPLVSTGMDIDTWISIENLPETRRATLGFSINGKGYVGLGYGNNNGLPKKEFWEYDPNTNSWETKADFAGDARGASVGFSINGIGYVGTGGFDNGAFVYNEDFWKYDPNNNQWTQLNDFEGGERTEAVGFSVNGYGYVGTGSSPNGLLKDFWKYDPNIDDWIQLTDFPGTARSWATGFVIDNKIYIGTGISVIGSAVEVKDFYVYDTSNDTWSQISDFPRTEDKAVGFSINGKGYVGTGGSSDSREFWEYDPANDTWTEVVIFPGNQKIEAVGFSIDGIGYVGSGARNGSATQDFWRFEALPVYQTAAPSSGFIANALLNDLDDDTKIQVEESSDEDVIRFDVGGTEALVIDASSDIQATGNVTANAFIGDGSQLQLTNLDINDADADPSNELNTNATLNGTTLELTDAGGTINVNLSSLQMTDWTIGTNKVYTLTDSVGIGESNPQTRLDVVDKAVIGNLNIGSQSTDQNASIVQGDGYTTTPWVYTNALEAHDERNGTSTLITIGDDGTYGSDDEINMVTRGNSRIRIDEDGLIGIRTEAETDLHIRQSSETIANGTGGIRYEQSNQASDYWRTYQDGTNFCFNRQGTRLAYIQPNGEWVATSDGRAKNSVEEITSVLDRVLQLRPVSYRYNHQEVTAQKTLGFIAQEAQPLFPEMIVDGGGGYLGMNYDYAGVIAIKTIQEQQAIIDEQKAKYKALEKEYEALEALLQAEKTAFEEGLQRIRAKVGE